MEELTRIRKERGLSQQALADLSSVTKATINQIERGRRSPNLETLEKLAEALEVEVADFFPKAQGALFPPEQAQRRSEGVQTVGPYDLYRTISLKRLVRDEQALNRGVESGRAQRTYPADDEKQAKERLAGYTKNELVDFYHSDVKHLFQQVAKQQRRIARLSEEKERLKKENAALKEGARNR